MEISTLAPIQQVETDTDTYTSITLIFQIKIGVYGSVLVSVSVLNKK